MPRGKYTRRTNTQRTAINRDNLSPAIAAGLTVGPEKLEEKPSSPDGVSLLRHMNKSEVVGRVPLPRFVGEDKFGMVTVFADGRQFRDKTLTFQPETTRAIQAGLICMRCLEPQSSPFADEHLPGCEGVALSGPRYMKDRQIMDFAMEYEGNRHLGPSKPITEYLDEMDAAAERRAFDKKIAGGKSPMRGLVG